MANMFHPEGKFDHYGGKLADIMWLNVLVFLCCLPVVTAGAAVSAMHYVLLKIHRDEEGKIAATFFKAFRDNFKQATVTSLIFGTVLFLLLVNLQIVFTGQLERAGILWYVLLIAAVIAIGIFNWSLILLSRYKSTLRGTIRLAITLCFAYPLRSVVMAALAVLPAAMLLMAAENLTIVLMAGIALTGLVQTLLYNRVFKRLENDTTQKKTDQQPDADGNEV